jgi:oligopeptide/dipeptide ABC transporter ATP-binding protein
MSVARIDGLGIAIRTGSGVARVVNGVSLDVGQAEVLALVGETGSGKSLTAMSLLGFYPKKSDVSGSIVVEDISMLPLRGDARRQVRGRKVAVILQNPSTALNPVFTVGTQISEVLKVHQHIRGKAELRQKATQYFREVDLPRGDQLFDAYPHELSGGMKQLVLLAIALACQPSLIVADEPTTALDVTTQAEVLRLFRRIQKERGLAALWITHDLGVAALIADRIAVLYAGSLVEQGPARDVLTAAHHPYTQALIASLPERGRRVRDLEALAGDMPSALQIPGGCPFHPRCPKRMPRCESEPPRPAPISDDHVAVCHLYSEETGEPTEGLP